MSMDYATSQRNNALTADYKAGGLLTDPSLAPEPVLERVEASWQELGRRYRMMRSNVLFRTDPVPETTAGGIHFPKNLQGLYKGVPGGKCVSGVVLAIGPKVEGIEIGDRLVFQRGVMAKLTEETFLDGTNLVFVDQALIAGHLEA